MVPMTIAMEDGYREQITTSGTGTGYIFQDGTAQQVTWQKADAKSQITFTDSSGKQVSLNRGQTWITALPEGRTPTWQ